MRKRVRSPIQALLGEKYGMTQRDYDVAAMSANLLAGVRERRKELGMTQAEVAERAGIHQEQVARLENGREPYLNTLLAVCWALDIHLIYTDRRRGHD